MLWIAGDCGFLEMGTMVAAPGTFPCLCFWIACLLRGYVRPRSKCEGRRASQQKRPINKDLPHQQSCSRGDACHSPLPHNHAFPTQSLSICPAIPPSPGAPCWFALEEPQLPGRILQQQGSRMAPVPNFPSQSRVGLSVEVKKNTLTIYEQEPSIKSSGWFSRQHV